MQLDSCAVAIAPGQPTRTILPDEVLEDLQKRATKSKVDNYVAGLIVLLVVPLFPLGAELIVSGRIEVNELLLATAIYVVSLGFASEWRFFFVISVLATLLLSISYGALSKPTPGTPKHELFACVSIVLAAGWTAFERYGRHVTYGRPFF